MHPALRQTFRPAISSTSSPTTFRSATATATRRTYAISAGGSPIASVFSNDTKRLHKDRAGANHDQSRQVDYLRDEVAIRLCDRLLDINRSFPRALDFGANACNIARMLTRPNPDLESDKKMTGMTMMGMMTTMMTIMGAGVVEEE
ncbi:hypothetical protein KC334_g20957, partial [Hortaea werneckii]